MTGLPADWKVLWKQRQFLLIFPIVQKFSLILTNYELSKMGQTSDDKYNCQAQVSDPPVWGTGANNKFKIAQSTHESQEGAIALL